jgi:hypothetical protein
MARWLWSAQKKMVPHLNYLHRNGTFLNIDYVFLLLSGFPWVGLNFLIEKRPFVIFLPAHLKSVLRVMDEKISA